MSTAPSPLAPALFEGFKRALPIVLGYVPVSFAFGVLAVKNDIPPGFAVAMSVLIYAGSGQFVAVSVWGSAAGAWSTIAAVFVVNIRHLLMSAALARRLGPMTRLQRFFFGYEMTDETFGVHSTAFQRGWNLVVPTLYACNVTAHASWVFGSALGAFFGELVTDVKPLGLDYALTAMFLALVIPQCHSRLHVLVGVFALLCSVAFKLAGMAHWNVVTATIVAASLGAFFARKEA